MSDRLSFLDEKTLSLISNQQKTVDENLLSHQHPSFKIIASSHMSTHPMTVEDDPFLHIYSNISSQTPCVENRSLPSMSVEDKLISGQPTFVQESILETFDEGSLLSTHRQPLNPEESLSSLHPTPLADMFMFSSRDLQLESMFIRPSSIEDLSLKPLLEKPFYVNFNPAKSMLDRPMSAEDELLKPIFEKPFYVNLNPANPMLDRPMSAEDELLKPIFEKPFYVNLNPAKPMLDPPPSVENRSLSPMVCLPHSVECNSLSPPSDQHSSPVVSLLSNVSTQPPSALQQVENFWLQWVEAAFPDLDSCAYFLPPVYFNRVPMIRQLSASQDVLIFQPSSTQGGTIMRHLGKWGSPKTLPNRRKPKKQLSASLTLPAKTQPPFVQNSDIRDDAAMQRVLFCLKHLFNQIKEVVVVMSQLQFGQYLGETCYTAAAAQLPIPANLPPSLPQNWKQGDFDVLLIHAHYGLLVCEVKSFGDNTNEFHITEDEITSITRRKLNDAISQLDKAKAMLSHLVSDIAPGLHITKIIAVPNLTARQVKHAISADTNLTRDLYRCLETTNFADIASLCLCSDQLSDPKIPWEVSEKLLEKLKKWWQRRVARAGVDSSMTRDVYKTLVARFCGPATTVSVPCTCPPRVSVKTLGQSVSHTGECYTAVITLFPEQLHLLHTQPPRVFVTGPPGTGKTVELQLMGTEWLQCGHHVQILSTGSWSYAASSMMFHMLRQTLTKKPTQAISVGCPNLLQYSFDDVEDIKKAVEDLSHLVKEGSLYVIADEVGPDFESHFKTFCDELLKKIPRLYFWAASCYHRHASSNWQVKCLTRPLRSPPVVMREIEQNEIITVDRLVEPYGQRGVPDHTDGPPIVRLYHRGHGHEGDCPVDCVMCGHEVANLLHRLGVGVLKIFTSPTAPSAPSSQTPPSLQWKDVMVLSMDDVSENSGMVRGLRNKCIPVRVMRICDLEDVATARTDVVWVGNGRHVRGLERKVVIYVNHVGYDIFARLHIMSRCTSQLVILYADHQSLE